MTEETRLYEMRRKDGEFAAVQWDGTADEYLNWPHWARVQSLLVRHTNDLHIIIAIPSGIQTLRKGDWMVVLGGEPPLVVPPDAFWFLFSPVVLEDAD